MKRKKNDGEERREEEKKMMMSIILLMKLMLKLMTRTNWTGLRGNCKRVLVRIQKVLRNHWCQQHNSPIQASVVTEKLTFLQHKLVIDSRNS